MKATKLKTILLLLNFITAAFLLIISCNNPAKTGNAGMGANTKSDSAASANNAKDAQFLTSVALVNMEEIKLGELAQQNGSMIDVKQLGEMMEQDHTQAQNELAQLAQKKSVVLPTSMEDNGQADYKKLLPLSGSEFDKEYCDMMVDGHNDAIAMFRQESTGGSDPEIKQWATTMIPVLQKHLDKATECRKKCNNAM